MSTGTGRLTRRHLLLSFVLPAVYAAQQKPPQEPEPPEGTSISTVTS